LPNLTSTADVLKYYIAPETVELFKTHKVLSEGELISRYNIYSENYYTQIITEANVMNKMAIQDIYPVANKYALELGVLIKQTSEILGAGSVATQKELLSEVLENNAKLYSTSKELEEQLEVLERLETDEEKLDFTRNTILPLMDKLRTPADKLELCVDHKLWPFPTYEELLFKL
jgi:glutamine synthetase